jgi:hypothetical protein
MVKMHSLLRTSFLAAWGLVVWLAGEQEAAAQTLLAQSGAAKTAIGWALVGAALFFALLIVGLPSWRKLPEGDAKPPPAKRK